MYCVFCFFVDATMSFANRSLCPMCKHWSPEYAAQNPPTTCSNCLLYMVPAGKEQQFISNLVPKTVQQSAQLSSAEAENQVGGILEVPMELSVENIFKKHDHRTGGHIRGSNAKHYVKAKHEAIQLECWVTEMFGKNPQKLQADKVR